MLSIAVEPFTSDDAQALVAAQQNELGELYGGDIDEEHDPVNAGELEPGRGVFLVARYEGDAVGCGAVRPREAGIGEIKRMYVVPGLRGRGIARAVLRALEARALELGLRQLVLETGELQTDAIKLYERAGYVRVPCFGEYAVYEGDGSLCFSKVLTASG